MNLRNQKRMSSEILNVGRNRVSFDTSKLKEIKEAITREDIRALIKEGAIFKKPIKSISRGRFRKKIMQKRKGRQRGMAKRKGTFKARNPKKKVWMAKVRPQRRYLKLLKKRNLLKPVQFKEFYGKVKGNFFRSTAHLKLYLEKSGVKIK